MLVSDARREANRRNAARSTGPKTQEGKDRSRMNSLKHGLCSEIVRVPEDAEAALGRARSWLGALKPQNTYHAWLMGEIAVLSLRVDRCGRIERRLRDAASIRAEDSWDDDRRSEAETIGIRLAERPAWVVDELRRSPQGCDWLVDRWALLARASARNGGLWTPDQRRLAFDLLGTPAELRDGEPGEVVDLRGEVVGPATDPAGVARREVESLMGRREDLAESDDFARSMVEADLVDDVSPEIRRIRRYEASLHKRLRWSVAQVGSESPRHRANSDLVLHHFAAEAEPEVPATPKAAPTVEPAHAAEPIPIFPEETEGPRPTILTIHRERELPRRNEPTSDDGTNPIPATKEARGGPALKCRSMVPPWSPELAPGGPDRGSLGPGECPSSGRAMPAGSSSGS